MQFITFNTFDTLNVFNVLNKINEIHIKFVKRNRGLTFNLHIMDEWRYITPNNVVIKMVVVTTHFPTSKTLNI